MNMTATIIDIALLKENPDNPRTISEEKIRELAESLQRFPQMLELRPIVINRDNVILGGNMRVRAAKTIGLQKMPAVFADNLSEEEQREFIIKDNLAYGEWDWAKLASDWPQITNWGLTIPEAHLPKHEAEEDDFRIPAKIKTDIVIGDLIEIDHHRVLCGDSRSAETWAKLFEGIDQPADLIITDPPYNVDYEGSDGQKIVNDKMGEQHFLHFLTEAFTAAFDRLKPGGASYIWHAESTSVHFRNAFVAAGFDLKQCLIWVKNALVMGRQDYQWKHEPCLYGWKPGAAHYFTHERTHTTVFEDEADLRKLSKGELIARLEHLLEKDPPPTTILRHDKPAKNDLHPTMKPVKLIGELMANSSRTGETVIDGFAGAGCTIVAAHQLNRRALCVELTPEFCQVIVDRMRKLDPAVKVKRNGAKF